MGNKQLDTTRRNYKDRALKLLFKFDRPTRDNIWHELCRHPDNCPTPSGLCDFPGGPTKGMSCRHVIIVKSLTDNINSILNDTFEF